MRVRQPIPSFRESTRESCRVCASQMAGDVYHLHMAKASKGCVCSHREIDPDPPIILRRAVSRQTGMPGLLAFCLGFSAFAWVDASERTRLFPSPRTSVAGPLLPGLWLGGRGAKCADSKGMQTVLKIPGNDEENLTPARKRTINSFSSTHHLLPHCSSDFHFSPTCVHISNSGSSIFLLGFGYLIIHLNVFLNSFSFLFSIFFFPVLSGPFQLLFQRGELCCTTQDV